MSPWHFFLAAVFIATATALLAQEPTSGAATLDDRVLALEQQMASLETRLATVTSVGSGSRTVCCFLQ